MMSKSTKSTPTLGGGNVTGVSLPLYKDERNSINANFSAAHVWLTGTENILGSTYSEFEVISGGLKVFGIGLEGSVKHDPQTNITSASFIPGCIINGEIKVTFDWDT